MPVPRYPLIPLSHLGPRGEPARRFRFMESVRRQLPEWRYSENTTEAYVFWIRRFVLHNGRRNPRELDAQALAGLLDELACEHRPAETRNQARAAVNFVYERMLRSPLAPDPATAPARRAPSMPAVLSRAEVRALFREMRGAHRLAAALMYGSGLTVSECASLRVRDIDLERRELAIRELVVRGKRRKRKRQTPLAERCVEMVRRRLVRLEGAQSADRDAGVRATGLLPVLERTHPDAALAWEWSYLFPARMVVTDTDGARWRHHVHESAIQRAVREGADAARLAKRVTAHTLRHSFAMHLLEDGADIRTVQRLLGHSAVRTTMVYARLMKQTRSRGGSPMDRL